MVLAIYSLSSKSTEVHIIAVLLSLDFHWEICHQVPARGKITPLWPAHWHRKCKSDSSFVSVAYHTHLTCFPVCVCVCVCVCPGPEWVYPGEWEGVVHRASQRGDRKRWWEGSGERHKQPGKHNTESISLFYSLLKIAINIRCFLLLLHRVCAYIVVLLFYRWQVIRSSRFLLYQSPCQVKRWNEKP